MAVSVIGVVTPDGTLHDIDNEIIRTMVEDVETYSARNTDYREYAWEAGWISTTSFGDPESLGTKCHVLTPCAEGDIFTITASGANSSHRPWCFIDSENNVLSKADTNTCEDVSIAAPANAAYLLCNAGKDSSRRLTRGTKIMDRLKSLNEVVFGTNRQIVNYRGSNDFAPKTLGGITATVSNMMFVYNGTASASYYTMRISGDIATANTSSGRASMGKNVTLLANHRYRKTLIEVDGTKTLTGTATFFSAFYGVTSTVVYTEENKEIEIIDVGSEDVDTFLYVGANKGDGSITFNNYRFAVLIEDITDEATTPQMYGAKGDGVTDDTAAFQLAINHGAAVHVPTSNGQHYRITDSLRIPRTCKQIYGDSKAVGSSSIASWILFDLRDSAERGTSTLRRIPLFMNLECQTLNITDIAVTCKAVNNKRVAMFMSAQQPIVDYDIELNRVFISGFYRIVLFAGRGFTVLDSVLASCNYLGTFKWYGTDTNANHPADTGQRALRFQNNRIHNMSSQFLYINTGHAYGLVFTGNVIDNGTGPLIVANHQAWNWNVSGNLVQGLTCVNKYPMQFKQGMKNCVIANNVFSSDTGYWRGTSLNPKTWLFIGGSMENCNIVGNNFKNSEGELIHIGEMYGSVISGNILQGCGNLVYVDEDGKKHDYPIDYDSYEKDSQIDPDGTDDDPVIDPEDPDYIDPDEEQDDDDQPDDPVPGDSHIAAIYVEVRSVHNSIVGNVMSSNNSEAVFLSKADDAVISDTAFAGNSPEAVIG